MNTYFIWDTRSVQHSVWSKGRLRVNKIMCLFDTRHLFPTKLTGAGGTIVLLQVGVGPIFILEILPHLSSFSALGFLTFIWGLKTLFAIVELSSLSSPDETFPKAPFAVAAAPRLPLPLCSFSDSIRELFFLLGDETHLPYIVQSRLKHNTNLLVQKGLKPWDRLNFMK